MAKRIAVVISQGQSANPAKRGLEEDIVAALLMEPGIDVTVIPHLYDLKSDGTGVLALRGISSDMIILSWLFERAARWTMDRHGVRGLEGKTLLAQEDESETDAEDLHEREANRRGTDGRDGNGDAQGDAGGAEAGSHEGNGKDAVAADGKTRVAEQRDVPRRRIYCVDLRAKSSAQPFLEEVRRIATECRAQLVQLGGWIGGNPAAEQAARYLRPTNDTALPLAAPPIVGAPREDAGGDGESTELVTALATGGTDAWIGVSSGASRIVPGGTPAEKFTEDIDRRWYPVIDYSRCTNCMECIDFCLFGVYGIDRAETILVEQPDNCRKGCPACSRVCPENAIIFPQHKTPAIAGAPVGLVTLKIDLSRLFGAPDQGKSAEEIAALERDEQLTLAGRAPVGMAVGMPKRQEGKRAAPKDDLDALLDELDGANL